MNCSSPTDRTLMATARDHLHVSRSPRRRCAGTVLIVTMFVVLAVAALSIVFARSSRVEAAAAANKAAQLQAEYIAHGAVQYIMGVIGANRDALITQELYDAEAVPVGDGYFWLIRPDPRATEGLEFGLIDESSKLNVNMATRDMLIKLPQMTDQFASSIIDWRDPDTDTTPDGAENDYYLSLDPAYYTKDGPFETIDELLLVRGATHELVFGEDTNRNNTLDYNEDDGDVTLPPDNRDGVLDRGLIDLLTVYSFPLPEPSEGNERVNINNANTDALRALLEDRLAVGSVETIITNTQSNRPYRNLIDYYIRAELQPDQFDAIWDGITIGEFGERPGGLINVNNAPVEVLATLPLLTEGDADAMVAQRSLTDPENGGFSWVVDALSQEKAVRVGDFITGQTYQYTVDVVAVSAHGRSFRRIRAVIDARSEPPVILHYADLSAVGWSLDRQILETLRAGEPLPAPRAKRGF